MLFSGKVVDGEDLYAGVQEFAETVRKIFSDLASDLKELLKRGVIKDQDAKQRWKEMGRYLKSVVPKTIY